MVVWCVVFAITLRIFVHERWMCFRIENGDVVIHDFE